MSCLQNLQALATGQQIDINQYALRLSSYAEVESILAQCRAAECEIEEISIRKADLEDVFIQVMNGSSATEKI